MIRTRSWASIPRRPPPRGLRGSPTRVSASREEVPPRRRRRAGRDAAGTGGGERILRAHQRGVRDSEVETGRGGDRGRYHGGELRDDGEGASGKEGDVQDVGEDTAGQSQQGEYR